MKSSEFKILIAATFLVMVGMLNCKDNTPTVQQKVEALLVSTEWSNPIVTVDGVDHSDLYSNLIIKFSKNTYVSSGGSPLWPASGTWTFKDENAKAIMLDSKMEVQINEITETDLELAVQWTSTTFESGRIQSITGKNIFHFKKK